MTLGVVFFTCHYVSYLLFFAIEKVVLNSEYLASFAAASWPGVLHALCICIDNEVAASKKRVPKILLAKALRGFVLKADDPNRAGQRTYA